MIRILLIASLALIVGCAAVDVPEVGTELRDYQTSEPRTLEAIALDAAPQATACMVEGEVAACFAGENLTRLEQFVEAAQANRAALESLILAYQARYAELVAILAAGQSAEAQAEIYQALYVAEANQRVITQIAAGGAAGLLLALLAL